MNAGVATLNVSFNAAGTPALTATYSGDSTYSTSTSSALDLIVKQATTAAALASSANPSVPAQSVTFTATLSSDNGVPANGATISFRDNGVEVGTGTLTSGVATFSTTVLALGTHPMTAVYAGDAGFTAATSSPLSQAVNKNATSVALTASANPVFVNQTVTLTATVSVVGGGTATGSVDFKNGVTVLATVPLTSGVATLIRASTLPEFPRWWPPILAMPTMPRATPLL